MSRLPPPKEENEGAEQRSRSVSGDGTTNEAEAEPGKQLEPGVEGKDVDQRRGEEPVKQRFLPLKADDPPSQSYVVLRHCAILGLLMFTSIWGVLAREGLVALNTYDGRSVEPTIWAQAVGCLVMGWAVANREALERWYAPAYIAIGTGFCGSLTTFSSWILHVFQAYGDQLHYNRHGLHNVMDALTQTAVTLGMSIVSLYAGRALAGLLPAQPLLCRLEWVTRRRALGSRHTTRNGAPEELVLDENTNVPYTFTPDLFSLLLGVAFWAGAAVLCGTYAPFRHVTFAVVLSPPGAIARWYLSRWNSSQRSKRFPFWPLGTLTANLAATAVLAAVFVGQRVGQAPGAAGLGVSSVNACNALYGVQEGFCGCLSTISTFAVELDNLKPTRRAVGYAVGSYVLGIAICVLIIGSPWWSVGMDGSCVGVTL